MKAGLLTNALSPAAFSGEMRYETRDGRAVLLGVQARGEDCPPADAEERHDDGVGEVRRDERKVLAPRPPARQRVVHAHHALHEGHLE